MKTFLVLLILSSFSAFAQQKCNPPAGIHTDIEMVLKQFVLKDGNPNWGDDWCYELETNAQSKACNDELDAWDAWLECAGLANFYQR